MKASKEKDKNGKYHFNIELAKKEIKRLHLEEYVETFDEAKNH